jgi:hypothetical protein
MRGACDFSSRYSFSYGLVHMIVLSSEHPLTPQVEFFLKDMAALQRSVTPWVIVHMHRCAAPRMPLTGHSTLVTPHSACRPPFSSCPRDKLDVELALTWHRLFVLYVLAVAPLSPPAVYFYFLRRWEIDFVMSGHVHYYERLCAVDDMYSCSAFRDRPIYISDGSAGAEFEPLATPPSNLTMHKEFSYWGYSRFAVTAESLTFTHYRTNNLESDKVMLLRK